MTCTLINKSDLNSLYGKTSENNMELASGLQDIGWSEKITPVLFVDVELVVITQRHILCFI